MNPKKVSSFHQVSLPEVDYVNPLEWIKKKNTQVGGEGKRRETEKNIQSSDIIRTKENP